MMVQHQTPKRSRLIGISRQKLKPACCGAKIQTPNPRKRTNKTKQRKKTFKTSFSNLSVSLSVSFYIVAIGGFVEWGGGGWGHCELIFFYFHNATPNLELTNPRRNPGPAPRTSCENSEKLTVPICWIYVIVLSVCFICNESAQLITFLHE